MPINDANEGTSKFYSFNLGPAHYIVLDTDIYLHEEYAEAALTQTNWLRQDLISAN